MRTKVSDMLTADAADFLSTVLDGTIIKEWNTDETP
jgi:hypothetical protein